ncbi:hypothetical protein [Streptomyces californicus]|uniref:hypothetical protein n=1 Tax=Streptomyces californicus TaxID=67351 RepID=UPI00296FBD21|nr:hypothetical protein [Streptomyces californicus]MDW4916319.1 hypothetical protein [Streptomyces californicus]
MSEELPGEALKTVIGALCSPAAGPCGGLDAQGQQWREKALQEALPALLARTSAKRLRAQLLLHADEKTLAALAADGTVTTGDLPAILRHRKVWPGLVAALARHGGQVDAAIGLLPRLSEHEVEHVVRDWDPDRSARKAGAVPHPPVPQKLFDAVLEACLTPLAAYLLHPEPEDGWEAMSRHRHDWSLELGGRDGWAMLARCPERWQELAAHPVFGSAVQHLLLDRAETQAREDAQLLTATSTDSPYVTAEPDAALSEELLRACLPALCIPELAELPHPQITAPRTLHHIAGRVRANPRVAVLAGEQLQAATDELVTRGRLLDGSEWQLDDTDFHRLLLRLVEDLALLSVNPDHLTAACDHLARMDRPAVVSPAPSPRLTRVLSNIDPDHDRPARLLERHSEHRRVQALATLAANPYTPRDAVTGVLTRLHPAELAWITERSKGPDWLGAAAAAVAPPEEKHPEVVQLLDDEALAGHPDPAAVLQSWLDSPAAKDDGLSQSEIYRAIIASAHHTPEHLRQIPADEVLTGNGPADVLTLLLEHCGRSSARWKALAAAMTFRHDEEKISLGQFLDSLDRTPARRRSS